MTVVHSDLVGLGGGEAVLGALRCSQSARVRAAGCSLLAALAENNERVQSRLVEYALPLLLHLIRNEPSTLVRIKALHAVSCTF